MQAGLVWGMWFGTPCNSFSRARRGPPGSKMPRQLRSELHPRGLPGLPPGDQAQVVLGNACADRAEVLAAQAYRRGLPGGEENPATSWLWTLPSRARRAARLHVTDRVVDYCAFGTPFRARARLQLWHLRPAPRLSSCRCVGRGVCSFSGRPHLQLTGATSKEGFLTTKKNRYPDGLCKILAKDLWHAHMMKKASRLWNLMR